MGLLVWGCLERSYQGAGYLAGTRACMARTLFPKGEGSVEVVSVGGDKRSGPGRRWGSSARVGAAGWQVLRFRCRSAERAHRICRTWTWV